MVWGNVAPFPWAPFPRLASHSQASRFNAAVSTVEFSDMDQQWIKLPSLIPMVGDMHIPALEGPQVAIAWAVRQGWAFDYRLIDIDLTGRNLEGIKAKGAVFANSLEGTNLNGAHLTTCEFRGSLRKAKAHGAIFVASSFVGADLSDFDANRSDFSSANLTDANCVRMSGRDCQFAGTNFDGAFATSMDVAGSTIFNARITDALLRQMATPYDDICRAVIFGPSA